MVFGLWPDADGLGLGSDALAIFLGGHRSQMFWKDDTRGWLRYTWVGLQFSVTFMGMLALGLWLDMRGSATPAWTLTLGAIGFGVALYHLIRQAMEIRKPDNQPSGPDREETK